MDIIDFFIGFTLMNAMPHFVLGVFEQRILSGLGYGKWANIGYSLIMLATSLILFHSKYGIDQVFHNGIYVGGITMLIIYYGAGRFCYLYFHKRHFEKEN